jgi:hypothetical protein
VSGFSLLEYIWYTVFMDIPKQNSVYETGIGVTPETSDEYMLTVDDMEKIDSIATECGVTDEDKKRLLQKYGKYTIKLTKEHTYNDVILHADAGKEIDALVHRDDNLFQAMCKVDMLGWIQENTESEKYRAA